MDRDISLGLHRNQWHACATAAPSLRQIEEGAAVGAATFQAGKIAPIGYVPAVVQPIVIRAGDEHAAAMRFASPPACVGDAHRGRDAQALRCAAMELRFWHERRLQIPALARGSKGRRAECHQ